VTGDVSLDFANTAEWHAGPHPEERLTSYAVAVGWARDHEILSGDQAAGLLADARAHLEAEDEALRSIIAFREALYRILSATAGHRLPALADLEMLDKKAREAAAHLRLVVVARDNGSTGVQAVEAPLAKTGADHDPVVQAATSPARPEEPPHFGWVWVGIEDDLTGFLWPVARAAAELLTSGQVVRLRECAGDPCGWLFLDLSKNGSRRWCDMADCGNRAKARRYRERKKKSASAAGAAGPSDV
jgi:predicted RNA-binding Zn ribbon-like protein